MSLNDICSGASQASQFFPDLGLVCLSVVLYSHLDGHDPALLGRLVVSQLSVASELRVLCKFSPPSRCPSPEVKSIFNYHVNLFYIMSCQWAIAADLLNPGTRLWFDCRICQKWSVRSGLHLESSGFSTSLPLPVGGRRRGRIFVTIDIVVHVCLEIGNFKIRACNLGTWWLVEPKLMMYVGGWTNFTFRICLEHLHSITISSSNFLPIPC